jgi:hypothetical protein
VVQHEHRRLAGRERARQPVEIFVTNASRAEPSLDAAASDANGRPWSRDRIDGGEGGGAQVLDEWGPVALDCGVETAPARGDHGRQIPRPQQETRQIRAAARVAAARPEVMIAVNDRRTGRIEQAARSQRVERAREKPRVPPVQQVAGQDEVIGRAGGDAVELPLERVHVGGVPQM